jgi:hypothetical protein
MFAFAVFVCTSYVILHYCVVLCAVHKICILFFKQVSGKIKIIGLKLKGLGLVHVADSCYWVFVSLVSFIG